MLEVWEAPEVVIAFGTLMAGMAAMWGAYSAFSGLSTWKEQQKWKRDFELAMSIYEGFRKRRQTFHFIRAPYKNPPVLGDRKLEDRLTILESSRASTATKLQYWQAMKDVEIAQAALFDEAKLRWGIDFFALSAPLVDLEYRLAWALDDLNAAETGKFSTSESSRAEMDAVLSSGRDESENFKQQYDDVFASIEEILRPKIL